MTTHGWGTGDLVSAATGVIVTLVGVCFRRNRNFERATKLLANGIALGPLLLILLSPLPQFFHSNIDLLEIAVNEARVTIFYAAAFAAFALVREM